MVDGNKRAVTPAVLELLGSLRLISAEALSRLAKPGEPAVRNTQGRVVGHVTTESVSRRASVAGEL